MKNDGHLKYSHLEIDPKLAKLEKRHVTLGEKYETQWFRFEAYEIAHKDDRKYLRPVKNAGFKLYNPFEVSEKILIDLLKIGDDYLKYLSEMKEVSLNAYRKRKTDSLWQDLLNSAVTFSQKYGLMGFISASTYNRQIIGDDLIVLSGKNSLGLDKIRTIDEASYIKLFTPFVNPGEIKVETYKDEPYFVKYEDTPKFYGKRPMVLDLIFSSFYAEDIQWLFNFAAMLSKHFDALSIYKKAQGTLTEPVTIMADKFEASGIGFTITQGETTKIAWEFDALMTIIKTIYGFALTDETVILKRCTHCRDFYFAKRNREKYCSSLCRNRNNVKRSRTKNGGRENEDTNTR